MFEYLLPGDTEPATKDGDKEVNKADIEKAVTKHADPKDNAQTLTVTRPAPTPSTTPSSPAPSTTATPSAPNPSPSNPALPRTGAEFKGLLALALIAIAGGLGMLIVARRKRM